MLDTFTHTDFPVSDLARAKAESGSTVSVVVPTRDAAGTIAHTVAELQVLVGMGIVDQVLVIEVGGESNVTNRPAVDAEEEVARVVPVVEAA
ncbi:MAG: hypothetical protein ACKORA_02855, partial [Solirubrobacterales bacterium]